MSACRDCVYATAGEVSPATPLRNRGRAREGGGEGGAPHPGPLPHGGGGGPEPGVVFGFGGGAGAEGLRVGALTCGQVSGTGPGHPASTLRTMPRWVGRPFGEGCPATDVPPRSVFRSRCWVWEAPRSQSRSRWRGCWCRPVLVPASPRVCEMSLRGSWCHPAGRPVTFATETAPHPGSSCDTHLAHL